jgi:hypothetical protein
MGAYAAVFDLRAEGIAEADASDARLEQLLAQASRYIERVTGRFFEPRVQELTVDGTGGRVLPLGHPIISIDAVIIDASPFSAGDTPVDPTVYRVYNRHLTQGLFLPDDRDNPKLELLYGDGPVGALGLGSFRWPRGQQNITVQGTFGYTEPDGSPMGKTPELIRHATKLLVMRQLPLLANADEREDAQRRFRLTSERTRDQSYTLEALRLHGAFTGDPEIDNILVAFVRPPDCGAA